MFYLCLHHVLSCCCPRMDRVYENEIDMLVHAIELIDEPHEFIVPEKEEFFKRMPEEKEKELFKKFEERKNI